MADETRIAWATSTFNPWIGCRKVSVGCANCYAERLTKRWYKLSVWGHPKSTERKRTSEATWKKVRKWNCDAAKSGLQHRVFCGSLMDWAEDHPMVSPWREELWGLIRTTPKLTWLLLTKRADRIAKCLPADWGDGWPHVWLGTSVENQHWAEKRIPHLLRVPARVRFVSFEPLLGPVELRVSDWGECFHSGYDGRDNEADHRACLCHLDWAIVGGESGPNHRPMPHEWAISLRDQCHAAGVAFFFKQSSAYRPGEGATLDGELVREYPAIQRGAGIDA